MSFEDLVVDAGRVVEGLGVAIILVGTLAVLVRYAVVAVQSGVDHDEHFRRGRRGIGKALLLGLEVLVAGDIIRTVAVEPTLAAAASLAVIVLIRTFLSWSIELETEGRWPWQREAHRP
ncbi:MAG TPA: DUF1622 domain-containing protein [Nitriliruptorales bacterium]|nr:DUF1622 domain-containing protein [Nitriliruptorales bacterium]